MQRFHCCRQDRAVRRRQEPFNKWAHSAWGRAAVKTELSDGDRSLSTDGRIQHGGERQGRGVGRGAGTRLVAVSTLNLTRQGLATSLSPDPTKRDASKEEFGRRALAGGNMWDPWSCLLTLLESFDINNPEIGIDSVARQMHQKTVQHYWVNILKQQVTGEGWPTPRDTLIQPMEAALNETTLHRHRHC